MKSFFPDVNVWIALSYRGHLHHPIAGRWFEGLDSDPLFFCRVTQLAFLRLLTNARVMGADVKSQREAWRIYDRWFTDPRIGFFSEPGGVEPLLRQWTQSSQAISNTLPDACLAALAKVGGHTLVTLDQGFAALDGLDALVLSAEIHGRTS